MDKTEKWESEINSSLAYARDAERETEGATTTVHYWLVRAIVFALLAIADAIQYQDHEGRR